MRRRVVAAFVAVASLAAVGAAQAPAAIGDIETPTVEGPMAVTANSTPWGATDKPLAQYGYVEEEYEYFGDAFRYDTTGDVDQDGTQITTGGPADDGKFPYRTRMIVRRPANPADFNGTVVVEWQNVTAQFDLEANWYGDPEYLLRNGYAYVAISAQRVGVNFLRGWDPGRYGDLDVTADVCPSPACPPLPDTLSYDIFAAGIKALLDEGDGVDPLDDLATPQTVIASGESQSGSRLSTYYNKVHPLHGIIDAFLITVSTGPVRHDTDTPVMRVLSETENRVPRTEPDADNYRHWEVAGGSHLPRMAYENFQTPIQRDLGIELGATCQRYPLSRVQWPLVVNSAYEHLVSWANGGDPPPIAPRGQYDPDADPAASDKLQRNDLGIAEGGIRLPEMTVPARLNTGINAPAGGDLFSALCTLYGSTEDLSEAILLSRYDDWADYVDQVTAHAEGLADQGFLLDQDVPRLIEMHKQVPNLRPTSPQRTAGKPRNKGKFTLSWQGTEAPQSTFELQHSSDGGATWSGVAGAGALDDPQYEFTGKGEKDGKWVYRVRSNTVIPADPAREGYTLTTPFSELSARTTVDGTKPKVKLKCPGKVKRGKRAFARIKASDRGLGLRVDPTGKKRIRTGRRGTAKVKTKAVDNLGNRTRKTCRVKVR